ncbi:ABC transporter permease [Actinoalloteichus spitiensis]|uniref:ABC transporter permease n=1 Tax=Actinoalloteichus spitiensis TaxID=252394 RepID=UPI00035D3076|nr:ABC transporter permease [Actinoalloteichus spitiensis]
MRAASSTPFRWLRDLALGIRLALTGRTPWGRMGLSAAGIALGVAALFAVATLPEIMNQREERDAARTPILAEELSDADGAPAALEATSASTQFQNERIRGYYLTGVGPESPRPPGVDTLPGPGESVVSPALRELLAAPEGELLRPRFPERIIGEIGPEGLTGPSELYFYAGGEHRMAQAEVVLGFGGFERMGGFSPILWVTYAVGAGAILVPVVVFVANATRLAESSRIRRLAALRLLGADRHQIRRLAVGESLLSTALGLLLGALLFALARAWLTSVPLAAGGLFPDDVRPNWWVLAVVVVGLPLLAVGSALFATRRVAVEPLGAARASAAAPRQLGWRAVPLLLGFVGMALVNESTLGGGTEFTPLLLTTSVVLMLASIPALLPWLVERLVRGVRGGPVAWQLAVRRLQLDSSTASRSVSSVAVVLAGVIALQAVLTSTETMLKETETTTGHSGFTVSASPHMIDESREEGVAALRRFLESLSADFPEGEISGWLETPAEGRERYHVPILIADCPTLGTMLGVDDCVDGASYRMPSDVTPVTLDPGETLVLNPDFWPPAEPVWERGVFEVPADAGVAQPPDESFGWYQGGALALTPRAAEDLPAAPLYQHLNLRFDEMDPRLVEEVRSAVWEELPATYLYDDLLTVDEETRSLDQARQGLWIGALITFALVASSLLVVAVEQIQERRRPLAVVAAVGARRRTLAGSVLVQTAIPMAAGLLAAVVVGLLIASLALVLLFDHFEPDWPGIAAMVGVSAFAVLVVTLGTLPTLRHASRPEELRSE